MTTIKIGDKVEWLQGGRNRRQGTVIAIYLDGSLSVHTSFKTAPVRRVMPTAHPRKMA